MGTSGNVFERLLARQEIASTLFSNSKNLESSSQKLGPDTGGIQKKPESEMRREPQHSSIHMPRFQSGGGLLSHTGGTYSHSGVVDYPRFPITELHILDNSLTLWNFKAGESTSNLKYVQNRQIFISQCNESKKMR